MLNDDCDIDIIHETMKFNQLSSLYLELEKYKIENIKLNKLIKFYKHESLFYKRYYDAIYVLLLRRHDLCEFIKWIIRSFKHHNGDDMS
jgi:hypothetical protein